MSRLKPEFRLERSASSARFTALSPRGSVIVVVVFVVVVVIVVVVKPLDYDFLPGSRICTLKSSDRSSGLTPNKKLP